MAPKKGRKLSAVVVEELQKRSNKGLEFAKKTMLAESIEYEKLRKALGHYVKNWNDFTHPGLFSLACEAVGGHPDTAIQVQSAIALLAAAFDIHDDIIDGSEQKHGVPTIFGKYGENIALLLGNAFLIKGFTLFYVSVEQSAQKKTLEIVEVLQKSLFELGNAHALELNLRERIDANTDEYMRVMDMKAASIEADMQIGAIVGGGSNKEVQALAKYGRILGTLATLREEFIDIFEVEELNQCIKGKALPIPMLCAFQDARPRKKITELLKKEITDKNVEKLLDIVLKSRYVAKLRRHMMSLSTQAVELSTYVRDEKTSKLLQQLSESALEDL
jgi:geranylgeranyl pyrophosphate synthase